MIRRRASLKSFKRTLRTYAGRASGPLFFSSRNWLARALSGSTSACARRVSSLWQSGYQFLISASLREADVGRNLVEQWMAAKADSTSGGGSMPVIRDESSAMP